jgi:hypothetical protein
MAVSISASVWTGAGIGATLSDRAAASRKGIKVDTAAESGLNMMAAHLSPGAISESSSSHLPPSVASKTAKSVIFPLGRSSRGTMPVATGSIMPAKTIGVVRVSPWRAMVRRGPGYQDDVGLRADQLLREHSHPIDGTASPPKVHPQVAATGPTQVRKA